MGWPAKSLERAFAIARRREARVRIRRRSDWQRTCLARARSCLSLADYAGSLGRPDREFSYEALSLLRQGCLWLLAYERDPGQTPEELLSAAPAPFATRGGEPTTALRAALGRGTFDDVALTAGELASARRDLQRLAAELLADREGPEREAGHAVRRACWALLGTASVAGLLGLLVLPLLSRFALGPNLAEGKRWKASSTFAVCDVAQASCAGQVTQIFFHTNEEDSPWIEFDLGDRTTIRRVDVGNRRDCCEERAVPLVVEVSEDERGWTGVAVRREPFETWTATFSPTRARYVRLRVDRRSMLHLESVAIR